MFDLRVKPGVEGSESTPGKTKDIDKEQMQRLAKLAKKHRNGHIAKVIFILILNIYFIQRVSKIFFILQVDWLDRLTFREIEMINEREKRNSDYLYLMIEFPTVQVDGINV